MPRECHLKRSGAGRSKPPDRHALKKISVSGGDIMVDRESTESVILCPDEIGIGHVAPALRAQDVEVSVGVKIRHGSHVVQWRANGAARPDTARRPRIPIPPCPSDDIRAQVSIDIGAVDKDCRPWPTRIDHMPRP